MSGTSSMQTLAHYYRKGVQTIAVCSDEPATIAGSVKRHIKTDAWPVENVEDFDWNAWIYAGLLNDGDLGARRCCWIL